MWDNVEMPIRCLWCLSHSHFSHKMISNKFGWLPLKMANNVVWISYSTRMVYCNYSRYSLQFGTALIRTRSSYLNSLLNEQNKGIKSRSPNVITMFNSTAAAATADSVLAETRCNAIRFDSIKMFPVLVNWINSVFESIFPSDDVHILVYANKCGRSFFKIGQFPAFSLACFIVVMWAGDEVRWIEMQHHAYMNNEQFFSLSNISWATRRAVRIHVHFTFMHICLLKENPPLSSCLAAMHGYMMWSTSMHNGQYKQHKY